MRSLAVRFGVAAIACLIGIVANTVLSTVRSSRSNDQCCDARVTVEQNHGLPGSWPESPAHIAVLEVQRSYDLSEVDITFRVQSLNGKSIANFEVWAVKSHDNVVDAYKRILAHSVPKNMLAAKEYTETVCVSLDRGFFRKRIDHLQLYLEWIEFTDGTRWHVPLEL